MEIKIYTEKARKLHSKLPNFRVKSEKNYTGQKEFTRAPPVTNMRYDRTNLFCINRLVHPDDADDLQTTVTPLQPQKAGPSG